MTAAGRPAATGMWSSGVILSAGLQRFGHYGIRSLLIIYASSEMKLSLHQAGQVYGLFYGSLSITALLGGLLGDSRLGYRRAGLIGLMCMALGSASLYLGHVSTTVLALGLYSLGYGLYDPSLNVAISHRWSGSEQVRSVAYTVLYTVINIGAMFGPVLFGYLALQAGSRPAFLFGSVWPLLAMVLFAKSTSAPGSAAPPSASLGPGDVESGQSCVPSRPLPDRLKPVPLAVLGITVMIFAAVFDQLGSSVTLLANGHIDRHIGALIMPAGIVQSINPLFVVLLGPLISSLMQQPQHRKRDPGSPRLLCWGLALLGLSFALMARVCIGIHAGAGSALISLGWIVAAVLLATVGELLFAPVSLAIATRLAPASRRALVLGAWSAMFGLGSYVSGTVAGLVAQSSRFSLFFSLSAGACLLAATALWLGTRYFPSLRLAAD